MQDFLPILIVLAVVLAVVAAIVGHLQREARRKALAAFAAQHGLSFEPGRDSRLDDRFPAFQCLRQGDGRYAFNLIAGPWNGRGLLAFDYHYRTHSHDAKGRRRTHHHHFSAIVLASDVPLRPLLIRPEGFLDRVKEFLGFDDIDFESAEFSRSFYVRAPDRKWAYDVIHARTMEFLLAAPRRSIQFDSRHVIVWDRGTFSPEEFAAAIALAEGVLERLPGYLVRQQQGEP